MADLERVKAKIAEIAQRQNNVEIDEIEWIVDQLRPFYPEGAVKARDARHGRLFRVDTKIFNISPHNPGSKQVKSCYVRAFLAAMVDLGWYEE